MSSIAISHSSSPREIAESRVIKIASYLRVVTWISLSLSALLFLWVVGALFWSPTGPSGSPGLERLITDGNLNFQIPFEIGELTLQSKLLLGGYLTFIVLFVTYCFMRLHILFGNFRNNLIFVKKNSELLRSLGYALVIGALLGGLLNYSFLFAISALDTSSQSFNLPDLKFTIGTSEILSVLTIGMVFLSAWILDIGRELYSEAELTI